MGSPTDVLATDSTTNKYLQVIQNGAGKIVPAKTTEVPGSLLLIAEPPEGFVSTPGALTADVSTSSLEAVQFTITDVGSSWTSARVTHRLRHKGRAITVVTEHPMVNRQRKRN
ncbi:MAG: hypothetical protein HY648_02640 [Acidobacteria bacterium]|nr:hypothetical protein [Acidobacteriota bacterium]